MPKVAVSVPEKSVKHINERQDTGKIDAAQVKKQSAVQNRSNGKVGRRGQEAKSADEILLTRSLNKELGLDDPGEEN